MKASSFILTGLALVAAACGIWLLVGVLAWAVRVLALVFLVLAVLSLQKKSVD
jgi:hypothetical protein